MKQFKTILFMFSLGAILVLAATDTDAAKITKYLGKYRDNNISMMQPSRFNKKVLNFNLGITRFSLKYDNEDTAIATNLYGDLC